MKKRSCMRRILAVALALSMIFALGVGTFADGENESLTPESDAKSLVQVQAAAAAFQVTVPSTLGFYIAADGTVTAPSNLEIENGSNGPVYVSGVTVDADCGWAIDANGTDYTEVPVNAHRMTLTLNDTNAPATAAGSTGSFGELSRESGYWPLIAGNNSMGITVGASFAPQGTAISSATEVCHVVYTVAWHTAEDGIDDISPSTPRDTYTVSYNANGGTGTMASASVDDGNLYQIAANKFVNGTRTLLGWATSASGDVVYAPRAKFNVTEDVELFAKWGAAPTYTVTFVTGEGSAVESQNVEEGNTATQPEHPTRSGYTFGGWYTSNSYTTEFNFATAIAGDTSIYAKWNEIKYIQATFHITDTPTTINLSNLSDVNIDWGDGSEKSTSTSHAYTEAGDYTARISAQSGEITRIGYQTFYDCSSLTSITIPDSVTSIANNAFVSCFSLNSISVESGNDCFSSENGVLFNKTKTTLIRYPEGKDDTSYTIPNGVTNIERCAFYTCTNLTNVTIPESVTSVGGNTFYDCANLESIAIPDGVTRIEAYAFYNCTSLTSVTIPDSVTSIGQCAFYNCSNLTGVAIPNEVTTIEQMAFRKCSNLTNVTIPGSVTSIGSTAFYGCSNLISVVVYPTTPPRLGSSAFSGRASFTITVPTGTLSAYQSATNWSSYASYMVEAS